MINRDQDKIDATKAESIELDLVVVPHTHWDREWYLTFQQFRMKLVDTVDTVLNTLESDPEFTYFMLDGQTIILEDYFEIRPENAGRLQALALEGRVMLGPWYLQPDEFLVGGESLIRNLQRGLRLAEPYGGAMPIGYVPDTFGHIGQLPQLLRGFGLDNAVFWRGVGPEIKKDAFAWQAPDGSEVLAIWLCDDFGYSNAAHLPLEGEALATRALQIAERMRPRATSNSLLLMNGSDHLMPEIGLPAALEAANHLLESRHMHLRIGTLPQYLDHQKAALAARDERLQTVTGELRSSYAAHLLPGVASSRMWLKQRNAAAEALLTRWTEPATCWAWLLGEPYPETQLELAWKFLMHNHPHDSICGCSIDQVHAEMMSRFAQSEQIASELTTRALRALAARVEIKDPEAGVPVVVFNAATGPRTEVVHCTAQLGFSQFEVVDTEGNPQPYQITSRHGAELFNQSADKELVMGMLGAIGEGNVFGYSILDAHVGSRGEDGQVLVEVVVAERGAPNRRAVERLLARARDLADDDQVTSFHIVAREATTTELMFLAADVPGFGGRLFFLRPHGTFASTPATSDDQPLRTGANWIENPFLRLEIDVATGTAALRDKVTGRVYRGLNRLVDSGDVGDLYNYCPPPKDLVVDAAAAAPSVELLESGPARATLRLRETYRLPEQCDPDRSKRASTQVDYDIVVDMSLDPSSRRVECTCTVDNTARDHRLRVLFPVPFHATASDAEGAFEIIRRPSEQQPPSPTDQPWSEWIESPVNTHPQKRFVDLSDGEYGLAVLNRGLAEYEVVRTEQGGSAIALTLLRCTEWLSRDDLSTRRGHAGPQIFTPDAQGLGRRVFEYALVPHAGTWSADDAFVLQQTAAYESPLRSTVTDQRAGGGLLPEEWSFVRVEPAGVMVSALKRSQDGEAFILRLCNPLAREVGVEITLAAPFEGVDIVDLSETVSSRAATTPLAHFLSNSVHTTLRGGEIQTLRFHMTPRRGQ